MAFPVTMTLMSIATFKAPPTFPQNTRSLSHHSKCPSIFTGEPFVAQANIIILISGKVGYIHCYNFPCPV